MLLPFKKTNPKTCRKHFIDKILTQMRETTIKRHRKIRKRYKELLGTDTVMNIYYRLGDEFCMSVDRIRQIIAMR